MPRKPVAGAEAVASPAVPAWLEISASGAELGFEDFLSVKVARLHSLIQREVTARYLEPLGLSVPEWRLLARLKGNAWLETRDLTRINLMDKAAISRAVDSLIEKGLVERHVDAAHAKRRIIVLTTAGKAMLRKAFPAAQRGQAALLRLLSAEERLMLEAVLARLADALKASPDLPPRVRPPKGVKKTRERPVVFLGATSAKV